MSATIGIRLLFSTIYPLNYDRYVNVPALMQRVVACMPGMSVDIGEYQRKRDLLRDGLADAGYDFTTPFIA